MQRDDERLERIRRALTVESLDAVVCALPTNVLLVSGYWPVIGRSWAIATAGGRVVLVVPEDERELAEAGWADEVRPFAPSARHELRDALDPAVRAVSAALSDLGLGKGGVLGYESGPALEPVSYASLHVYGAAVPELLLRALPGAKLQAARPLLRGLRARLTALEAGRVRLACRPVEQAFLEGARRLRPGLTELDAAAAFRAPLAVSPAIAGSGRRGDGFTFCMAGPNAAQASAAFQISGTRPLGPGELALVHCNSNLDGYWTDVTRTFCLGRCDGRTRAVLEAVLEARRAALDAVRPGARAADVDAAARAVMARHGLGDAFRHGLGHGVGFAAIDHDALPRLHPASRDVLEPGMVFNVEPAAYFDGWSGVRHCDMVLVTGSGAEVLTSFQSRLDELLLG